MKIYLFSKLRQIKNISWFCAGLSFGWGLSVPAAIALVVAIGLDVLYGVLKNKRDKTVQAS